jgi:hypothetical protein
MENMGRRETQELCGASLQAEGPRFEPATAHQLIYFQVESHEARRMQHLHLPADAQD